MENMPQLANAVNVVIVQSPAHHVLATATVGTPTKILQLSGVKRSAGGTFPLKPAKKRRKEDNEIVRCKRRLDFARWGLNLQHPHRAQVVRRNERERNRIKLMNNTFASLREHLPDNINGIQKSTKMSKVDTLKAAINYIQGLQDLLDDHNAFSATQEIITSAVSAGDFKSAAFSNRKATCSPPIVGNTNKAGLSQRPQSLMLHRSSIPVSSPGCSSMCGLEFESPNDAPFSPEGDELFDFASWFQ